MAYAQGTITSPTAGNDVVGILDGLLISAGWTMVETLTPSGDFRNRVYKSPGASNLCGYDWYVAICWSTTTSTLMTEIFCGEAYNAGTHMLTSIVGPSNAQNDFTNAPDGRPVTGATSSSSLNMATKTVTASRQTITYDNATGGQSNTPGFQTILPTSSFGYWISVTLDHVGIWTTVATTQDALYSTLIIDADYEANTNFNHTPIVMWDSTTFSISSHILGVTPSASTAFTLVHATFSGVYGSKLPQIGDTYFPTAYAWKPIIELDYLQQGSTAVTARGQLRGGLTVGQVPDIYLVWGGSVGDTVTIDSETHVLSSPMGFPTPTDSRPTMAVLVE